MIRSSSQYSVSTDVSKEVNDIKVILDVILGKFNCLVTKIPSLNIAHNQLTVDSQATLATSDSSKSLDDMKTKYENLAFQHQEALAKLSSGVVAAGSSVRASMSVGVGGMPRSEMLGLATPPRQTSPSRTIFDDHNGTSFPSNGTLLGLVSRNGALEVPSGPDCSVKGIKPNVWSHDARSLEVGQAKRSSHIRHQRRPRHLKMTRSAGASREVPREIDWSHADKSKWKFESVQYNGQYYTTAKCELEEVNGLIQDGLTKLQTDPGTYEGMLHQTDMRSWPPNQQKYTLVRRTGSGFRVAASQAHGPFTYVHAKFEALPPDVSINPDQYTDWLSYGGQRLGTPQRPGRGDGCADVPDLKIIDASDPSDVTQGSVGDCWLLSAISALSEYDGAIRYLFRRTPNLDKLPSRDANKYVVTLFDLPTWQPVDITIDERLCARPDGHLLGCQPSATGELWVCYLEKAIAAHCGGWDKIKGGTSIHAWRLLTGCKDQYTFGKNSKGYFDCLGALNANTKQWEVLANSPHDGFQGLWPMPWPRVGSTGNDNHVDENGLFERMCAWDDNDYIMAAGTRAGSDRHDHDGIVDGHAYAILDCINDAGGTEWDMIKLRNPHGQGEFTTGKWRDDGPGWLQYPQVKAACNPIQLDDGIFWMDRVEFFQYFDSVYLCACDMSEFLKSMRNRPSFQPQLRPSSLQDFADSSKPKQTHNSDRRPSISKLPSQNQNLLRQIETSGWNSINWKNGFTMLHWAAKKGDTHAELCGYLMSLKGDPNMEDGQHRTPLSLARKGGHRQVVGVFEERLRRR